MIYLVSLQQELFANELYQVIDVEESLRLLDPIKIPSVDTETSGRNPHLCKLLTVQIGNKDTQIVIDCTTIDILRYKEYLESRYLIFQNAKFDLQFFYSVGIIPRKIYDTMIVEQLLHLGYPQGSMSYSLQSIAQRRLDIFIDKSVRGEIQWRGLDSTVIKYAAGDIVHLEDIMKSQLDDCRKQGCTVGAILECDAIPAIAYMEWCGIHLDADKWKVKMQGDVENLTRAKNALDEFIKKHPELSKKYTYVNLQGDLFEGFDLEPKCTINWSSSQQVCKVAKDLGFNVTVQDKKTGADKESVLEKHLKSQKGINDEFLKLYFDYQEFFKVTTSFGQGHLNAINPVTDRIHTTFKQLGASSGRMSCGSQQANVDLAKYKGISPTKCTYPNIQQLPSDAKTRESFTAPNGYLWCSCDFSAEESRLAADIYNDKAFLEEFINGGGDTHNLFAWAVFKDECIKCGCKGVSDVKKLAPQWRKAVKAVEFAYLFGAAAHTISQAANCTVEEAQSYIDSLDKEFYGVSQFAKKGSEFVRKNGYILICPYTGHKLYWWDHDKWLERQKKFTPEFWENYRLYHKGTGDEVALEVRQHFQAASKYDRLARNCVTQGTGAIILKDSMKNLFDWIVDNGYFGKVEISAAVHDEINCIYPEEVVDFPERLKKIMETSASKYCKKLPIPAEPEIGLCWIH